MENMEAEPTPPPPSSIPSTPEILPSSSSPSQNPNPNPNAQTPNFPPISTPSEPQPQLHQPQQLQQPQPQLHQPQQTQQTQPQLQQQQQQQQPTFQQSQQRSPTLPPLPNKTRQPYPHFSQHLPSSSSSPPISATPMQRTSGLAIGFPAHGNRPPQQHTGFGPSSFSHHLQQPQQQLGGLPRNSMIGQSQVSTNVNEQLPNSNTQARQAIQGIHNLGMMGSISAPQIRPSQPSRSQSLSNNHALASQFEDVEYKVECSFPSSRNTLKSMVSNVASQLKSGHNYKEILKGITGSVGPGQILALMGPSGSGKSTILKILGGRLHENVKGNVTYNDIPYNPALKRRIGFVNQDDILLPQLTVEETLIFAAFLRLPSSMTRREKYQRVETAIAELGLERCRHTRIGGAFVKGVCGGERKRTSIGYEILVDPSLLLLDEPTSGLDSTTANRLLQILQTIAKAGRTIITSIHQPSSRMFHMFDKLLLISGGYPVYYGQARASMEYFSSLSFVPQLAMNPAEFLLDLATEHVDGISIPQDISETQPSQNFENDVIKYLHWKYKTELEPKEKEENHRHVKAPKHLQVAIQVKKDWAMSWWEQFKILAKRTFRERYRDYFDKLRMMQTIGVAILLGLLWWKSKTGTEAQLRDQVGLMFYICVFWTSSSIYGAVYVFPFEKTYLVKERQADMYRLGVYYLCSTLCDMAVHILYSTIFMFILYFMAGFRRTVPCFFLTLCSSLLIVITGQGAGELLGASVLSIKRAGTAASSILMLFLLTGGYYVQHIPAFIRWLKYISSMYHGFKLLLKVQYNGEQLYECGSKGGCRTLQSSPSFDTVNLNGGFKEVWILIAMAIFYRFCAYFCLRRNISHSPF